MLKNEQSFYFGLTGKRRNEQRGKALVKSMVLLKRIIFIIDGKISKVLKLKWIQGYFCWENGNYKKKVLIQVSFFAVLK